MDDSFIHNVLGSATAGIVARIFTHPLDTAKARLQFNYQQIAPTSNHVSYRGPVDVLVRTFQTEGIQGLYRGFGAILVGGTPGTMMYLCSYEMFKTKLSEKYASQNSEKKVPGTGGEFLIHFISGMAAETFACIVYVPVDIVKERLQVQHGAAGSSPEAKYRGSLDALKQIIRYEGISGIYRGYAATLASYGPFSAFYFVFYERFKFWARQRAANKNGHISDSSSLEDVEIPFLQIVGCSASAGAIASWMTSPLDMAKLRLQVQRGGLASSSSSVSVQVHYHSVVHCLRHVYKESGVAGLFRGAGARVMHFAPAMAITMTSFETCKSYFAKSLSDD